MSNLDSYDYIVVGAGVSGLAFVDSMMSHSNARIALIDRRPDPGGHWNDAYPFIRLHLPSHMYGVNTRAFAGENTLGMGANRHLLHMASGTEVLSYCKDLLESFLALNKRVSFYGGCEFDWNQKVVVSRVDGTCKRLEAKLGLVDTAYSEPNIPALQQASFIIEEGCPWTPVHRLPDRLGETRRYCVVGGGKSGVDACLWLMENSVLPDDIRWVVPRQPWWIVRERLQFTSEFAEASLSLVADQLESLAAARSVDEVFWGFEKRGVAVRLDPQVIASAYRGASISLPELAALREITDVVRLGRLQSIGQNRLTCEMGQIPAAPDTLYIDCSADGLPRRAPKPIFEKGMITLQMVKPLRQAFSAAAIGYIEATFNDIAVKNRLCRPIASPREPYHWLEMQSIGAANQRAWSAETALSLWARNSRLDPGAALADRVDMTLPNLKEIQRRTSAIVSEAMLNCGRLLGNG